MVMTNSQRLIRKAELPADGERIMEVFAAAKGIMRASGNMHQWGEGYPSLEAVRADIRQGGAYVVEEAGVIVGYFAFLPSPEPTYARIYDGCWTDDSRPYHVIHRIASMPETRGVFGSIIDYCLARDGNLRIDTHRDNRIMQHLVLKHGFAYCGIIFLANGDERLAYQRATPEIGL